jgi:hypothetical protein
MVLIRLASDLNLGLTSRTNGVIFLNVNGVMSISDNSLLNNVIVMITDFFLS